MGGNNVGKSTLLRQLSTSLSRPPGSGETSWLVRQVKLQQHGSPADLVSWLLQHAHLVYRADRHGFVRPGVNDSVPPALTRMHWGKQDRLGLLKPFFVHYADAQSRLDYTQGYEQRTIIAAPPEHPIHYFPVADLLAEVDSICKEVFGQPLTLDRLSRNAMLRVGEASIAAPPVDRVTAEYREALSSLPPLYEQGDGMRSFLGLLLPLITATHPIVIIDEPEAFLHPPQALLLGGALARLAHEKSVQVVLATHDRNLLVGLLEAQTDVSVVRLVRDGNSTVPHQLDAATLRTLWNKPELRYSNVLDGLFHRLVVLAEEAQDCRFYAAALDEANRSSSVGLPPSEILFVPSGGKDGMPKLAQTLGAVRVPVVATPDLDMLDDAEKCRTLVESLGGDWSSVGRLFRGHVWLQTASGACGGPRQVGHRSPLGRTCGTAVFYGVAGSGPCRRLERVKAVGRPSSGTGSGRSRERPGPRFGPAPSSP